MTFINTSHVLTITALAVGIKISKNWYLRQKENLSLEKQNIISKVKLRKAGIYPSFINYSLNNLHRKIAERAKEAPEILLKLSEILSFILYEIEYDWVSLEHELSAVNNLIDIEKKAAIVKVNTGINTSDNIKTLYITPMILFSFIQNILWMSEKSKNKFEVNISTENSELNLFLGITENGEVQMEELAVEIKNKMDELYFGMYHINFLKEAKPAKILLSTLLKSKVHVS